MHYATNVEVVGSNPTGGTIRKLMLRMTGKQLRQLIEAEVDRMRLPKGPNSRDDAEFIIDEEDMNEDYDRFVRSIVIPPPMLRNAKG